MLTALHFILQALHYYFMLYLYLKLHRPLGRAICGSLVIHSSKLVTET